MLYQINSQTSANQHLVRTKALHYDLCTLHAACNVPVSCSSVVLFGRQVLGHQDPGSMDANAACPNHTFTFQLREDSMP